MENFAFYKLMTDLLLIGSVLFFAFRVFRQGNVSGRISQIMVLEATLKGLIKDAESASRELNSELLKRERGLDELLRELQKAERDARELLTQGEDYTLKINEIREEIHSLKVELDNSPRGAVASYEPPVPDFAKSVTKKKRASRKKEDAESLHPNQQSFSYPKQAISGLIEREVVDSDEFTGIVSSMQKITDAAQDSREVFSLRQDEPQYRTLNSQIETLSNTNSAQMRSNSAADESGQITKDSRLGVLGLNTQGKGGAKQLDPDAPRKTISIPGVRL